MPVPCIIIKQKTRKSGFFVLYWLRGKATAVLLYMDAKVPNHAENVGNILRQLSRGIHQDLNCPNQI
jgi:hypothetical protein